MDQSFDFINNFLNKDDRTGFFRFGLNIGHLGVNVYSEDGKPYETALEKYEQFLTDEEYTPEVVLHNLNSFEDPKKVTKLFEGYTDLHTHAEGDLFYVYRWDFYGIINIETLSAKFVYFFDETFMSYESIIRIFYSILTVENHGFLMHSSSLIHNDKGYLFTGISGAGKSTVVKLSEPDVCLSDELSMIVKHNGEYIVNGTPFHGEIPLFNNQRRPLANLFILKKSLTTFFEKMDNVDAYASIMRNILFFSDDWGMRQKIFATTVDLVNNVGVYEMNFEKNDKFWKIIDNGFNENN